MSKSCAHCTKELPTSSFYNNKAYPDGLDHYCKTCRMEANAKTPKRKREEEESEDPDVGEGDALYVLHNSLAPHQFKVGRSKEPERRRLDMQRAQNFTVTLDAVFPGRGWMEPLVHARLAPRKVPDVPGREWFEVKLVDVLFGIANCVAADEPLRKMGTEPKSSAESAMPLEPDS